MFKNIFMKNFLYIVILTSILIINFKSHIPIINTISHKSLTYGSSFSSIIALFFQQINLMRSVRNIISVIKDFFFKLIFIVIPFITIIVFFWKNYILK